MEITWLGWAGVEIEAASGETVVIDALEDATAVFAPFGDRAGGAPEVVPPRDGTAVAGLITHLHRDHADATALTQALTPGAPVLEPPAPGGDDHENLFLLQADHELARSGLERRRLEPWERTDVRPFTITALPAVDGLGEPQVSWCVEADGDRVAHLGVTVDHGFWWRISRRIGPIDAACVPVNGAVISFPHRQPPSPFSAALDPEHAAVAAEILGSRLAIPMHAEGYEIAGVYEPVPDAVERFVAAARQRGIDARAPGLGAAIELATAGV